MTFVDNFQTTFFFYQNTVLKTVHKKFQFTYTEYWPGIQARAVTKRTIF